jgi:hypothetical protein
MSEYKHSIRCLNDKFFDLMSKTTPNDNSSSIQEQIKTEELVQSSYDLFLDNYRMDSE